MIYQTKYNTQASKNLLQVFIYMLDKQQITYDEYYELTGQNNFSYTKVMQNLKQMIETLNMQMLLSVGTLPKQENQFEQKLYILNTLDEPYKIEYENKNPNELILYSLVITYCLLKQRKYVSLKTLSNILPNFNKQTFSTLISKLKEVISEEIYKNELQSYILEDVE